MSVDELLLQADVILLHCSLTQANYHLLDKAHNALMVAQLWPSAIRCAKWLLPCQTRQYAISAYHSPTFLKNSVHSGGLSAIKNEGEFIATILSEQRMKHKSFSGIIAFCVAVVVLCVFCIPSVASAKKFFCEIRVETDLGTRSFSDTWDFKAESTNEAEVQFFSPNNCHRVCGEKLEWPKHGKYHLTKCSQTCMNSGIVRCREPHGQFAQPVKPALINAKRSKANRPLLYSSWVGKSDNKPKRKNGLYIPGQSSKKKALLLK